MPSIAPIRGHLTSPISPRWRTSLKRTSSGPSNPPSGRRRIATDDCKKTYETLKARGVEITSEPTEHFYGTDFGLRDPFDNNIRVVQLATVDTGLPKTLDAPKAAKA